MSLTHILDSIKSQTEEEIKQIREGTEKEKQNIIQKAQIKADAIRKRVKADFEKKTQEKINKAQRSADLQTKNTILLKKKEILNDVFAHAVFKLSRQEDKLKILYEKLIAQLPADQEGEILVSDSLDRLSLLKKEGLAYIKEEGFKFMGETIEIDNTLSQLILEVRDEAEIEAAKVLFNI